MQYFFQRKVTQDFLSVIQHKMFWDLHNVFVVTVAVDDTLALSHVDELGVENGVSFVVWSWWCSLSPLPPSLILHLRLQCCHHTEYLTTSQPGYKYLPLGLIMRTVNQLFTQQRGDNSMFENIPSAQISLILVSLKIIHHYSMRKHWWQI